jgi:hypothetical protein
MRKKLLLILSLFVLVPITAQSEDYPLSNPAAGNTTYDYNLNINDTVTVIDGSGYPKTKKVYAKKTGMYQVADLDVTAWELKNDKSAQKWYKANSVYPFIDIDDFMEKTKPYKTTIASLLNCLSTTKNIPLLSLTGTTSWPTYYIADDNEYNTMKADLDNAVKVLKTFKNLPNTFLAYEKNPAIWIAVVNDGTAYLDCLKAVGNPDVKRTVTRILDEIAVAKTKASNFTGGTEGLYVCDGCYEYMFCAVSPTYRKDWFDRMTGFNSDAESVKNIDAAFNDLKTVCASKISLFKMADWYYKYADSGNETVMKNYLKNSSVLTIHRKGMSDSDWLIEKDAFNVPLYRYKRGQMLIRNPANDHPYCKGLFYVIKQDYSGGGSYGASYVNEYHEELCGCP